MKHTLSRQDVRQRLDTQLDEAQPLNGVPILPCEEQAGDAALIEALADVILSTCVIELPQPTTERKVA